MELTSTLTCPYCHTKKQEKMPLDACQFFYKCSSCGQTIKAKEGDCCVFCSFGDVKCPSKQVRYN